MKEKIVGILGGMGPFATVYFFSKILELTGAKKDQDHLRIIIDNNPKIPDRTLSIKKEAEDPLPFLIESAKLLEKAGADFIVIPCVTAHYFLPDLKKAVKIPILSIIEETVRYIKKQEFEKFGLLATTGTINAKLFDEPLKRLKRKIITPDASDQERLVMEAIYGENGIKRVGANEKAKNLILEAVKKLIDKGAQAIIEGCTEIPLVLKEDDVSVPIIDVLTVLARATVDVAKGRMSAPECPFPGD
ncbi:MAG: amino acid racemase [Desulfobacterota bacterium]|nr:amino acid racemase [Thermodesulfobacteriota bacterium]MDW8002101.1 amino acid racemase [Deltaproteobacteria bacterium]